MAWNDYTTFGLVPKAIAGATKTPLFNFNNSGYQTPTMNASGFTPTLGMGATKPIVKPKPIVTAKPKGLAVTTPKGKTQSTKNTGKPDYRGMSQPPPALGSTAQTVTPVVAQDMEVPVNTMAPTGLTMDAIIADPSKYASSDFSNYGAGSLGTYGNSGGLGDYAQIPDGSGGTIGVDQTAYDAIQNPTIGSGGNNSWLDGMSNYETLQGAAGLGGLAMNAYGMFGSGGTMDVNKKNIELMNQQIANNREEMATRQARGRDISAAFGPKTGLGA